MNEPAKDGARVAASSGPDLLFDEPSAGIRRLTFNRPETLNALTHAMLGEILDFLEGLRFDLACRVVIVTGSGRGFCSGHDREDTTSPPRFNRKLAGIRARTRSLRTWYRWLYPSCGAYRKR